MAFRLVVLCAALACANAGYLGAAPALAYGAAPALAYGAAPALAYGAAAPVLGSTYHGNFGLGAPAVAYGAPALAAPAITSQHSNIIRSFGNLGQVSTYSKSIDTPYSSVRKADIRVSNPGIRTVGVAAPAYGAYGSYGSYGAYGAYGAAPALAYGAAPAISTYHGAVASPVLRTAAYAAPALAYGAAPAISAYHGAIASPVLRTAAYAAPALGAYHGAIGVGYSAAPAVSHLNYASAYANYGW